MRFRFEGFGFWIKGLRVKGDWFRIWGLGSSVQG